MKYQLFRQGSDAAEPVFSGDFESDFAATDRAREWVQANADHDRYRLQRADGKKPMLLLKTVAGQWYAMPLSEEKALSPAP